MATSTQEVVSDGTLVLLDLSINYLDRSEITVLYDNLPAGALTWSWVGVSEKRIVFSPAIANGVTVLVKRTTDISKLRHEFSLGAAFAATTLDEDLNQVLHIAQEAAETTLSGSFNNDISLNGNKILGVAAGVNPTDGANVGQLSQYSDAAAASQAAAAASQAAATASANLAQKWASENEDVAVTPGQFSAKHWAAKAMLTVTGKLSTSGGTMTGLLNLAAGTDIASAATVDLTAATGNTVRITGTTAITAFTMNAGQQMELVAVGALPLTHHATTMNINGGASYTCAAGDRLSVFKDGAGVVRVNVTKQDGTSVVSAGVVGEIIDHSGTTAPAGYLACPITATNISRTAYAALFAVIGTTWGAGDGSTTFGMPWFPADYTAVQANANVGTSTTGEVKAHTHSGVKTSGSQGGAVNVGHYGDGSTASTGGTANLAAGVRVLKCVKY